MPKTRIASAIFIAILAVSTASIFIKFAQREAPSLVIAALRLIIASAVLLPAAVTRHRPQLQSLTKKDWLLAALAGFLLSLHFAAWITSLEYTSVVSSVIFVGTGPLWVALLSPVFLREIPTRTVWIGMLIAMIGGLIVGGGDACSVSGFTLHCPPLSRPETGSAFLGNFLALAGAWAVAGYLIIGRTLRAKMDLIPYISVVYSAAAVALTIFMLAAGQSPFGFSPATYLYILGLALVPQLIGHSTYNWALKYMPASLVSVTILGEPVGSAILAFFLLGETPSLITLLGGGLILLGIYISTQTN